MSRARVKKGGGRTRSLFESKSSWNFLNRKIKCKERCKRKILGNEWEFLGIMTRIISGNYDLVYNITWLSHGKVEIYRDTGVYKNLKTSPHTYTHKNIDNHRIQDVPKKKVIRMLLFFLNWQLFNNWYAISTMLHAFDSFFCCLLYDFFFFSFFLEGVRKKVVIRWKKANFEPLLALWIFGII